MKKYRNPFKKCNLTKLKITEQYYLQAASHLIELDKACEVVVLFWSIFWRKKLSSTRSSTFRNSVFLFFVKDVLSYLLSSDFGFLVVFQESSNSQQVSQRSLRGPIFGLPSSCVGWEHGPRPWICSQEIWTSCQPEHWKQ